jgi:calpain-7
LLESSNFFSIIDEPEPYKDGIRINSPHYLVKLTDDFKGTQQYTLVISQYEKSTTIYYTLKAYSTIQFELNELKESYNSKYKKEIVSKWSGKSAGGCGNYPDTYKNNPLFQLEIQNNEIRNCVKIELRGPQ